MSYDKIKNLPLVVIFGRTNVGKSTLFNCLTEKHHALVSDIEGTTRDSNIGQVSWQGIDFELIDTGGIIDLKYLTGKKLKTEDIEAKVQQQARDYIQRADLILFLVDNKTGLLPQDKQMALLLKKILPQTDKIILVANKVDSLKQRAKIAEFYKLSFGQPIPVSAATGSGTGDLLDIVTDKIKCLMPESKKQPNSQQIHPANQQAEPTASSQQPAASPIKVCIIGKPNVGKSSLLNLILGYQRIIVSPLPHTTREPQDTDISYQDQPIKLIDTAGISKKAGKISVRKNNKSNKLISYGINKSLAALKKSDISLLVLDISQDITHQDAKLIEEIIKRKKSIIIIANKWDLAPSRETKKYTQYINSKLPFITWAPIQFTSALTGEKVHPTVYNKKSKKISLIQYANQENKIKTSQKLAGGVKTILDLVLQIREQRQIQLGDSMLNKFLLRLVKLHLPTKGKGTKHPRIYQLKQVKTDPPKFEVRIGAKDNLHYSYLRFIENRLREKFGFLGTPITIKVTKK